MTDLSNTALVAVTERVSFQVETKRSPLILCAQQGEIRIEFDEDGNASIIQRNWPDEDSVIRIWHDNTQTFLDRVCDAFGVATFGGAR